MNTLVKSNIDYVSVIKYFDQFKCDYIVWIFIIIQIHYFLLNGYLFLTDKVENYYPAVKNNNWNKILDKFRDYLLFALFEQIYSNSLTNIFTCYFEFDKNSKQIIICGIYGIFRAVYFSNFNYIGIILQIIFGFSTLMIYYDLNELVRLHINMYVNTIYFLMYYLTYWSIHSHKSIGVNKFNEFDSKSTKKE